jgi:Protein of unknown function (DUF3866)
MLTLRRGLITAVAERVDGLVRLEVDGEPCIAYPWLTGPVAVGDDVIVNTQARDLELGSGGFDILYANLTRGLGLQSERDAHVMKLPYTPVQNAVRHAEEGRDLPESLAGLPVVCCSLHSQLSPVCAGIGRDVRTAFVQLAGGALPLVLSDAVRALRERDLLATSVTAGPCFGGAAEFVSVASALLWLAAQGFEVAVCGVGPGIVGTGSRFGHGGLAAAEAANVATALDGFPIVVARASDGDARERHRGVAHHTRAVLDLCLGDVIVPWPKGYEAPDWLSPRVEVDVTGWEQACADLPLAHMGRTAQEDPLFFAAAFAAGRFAGGYVA